jgi:hypothetical protein
MSAEERAAWIQGMRRLLDKMEQDETIPLPRTGMNLGFPLDFGWVHHVTSGEGFAAIVAAIGGTDWQQETKDSGQYEWLEVTGRIDGLHVKIVVSTDKVCEPVEPRPVIERRCPALDAVIAEAQEGGAE